MTGKSGRRRSAVRLVKSLERQGARIKKTRDGWRVFHGPSVITIHAGSSDVNAWRNLRTDIQRAGLEWPSNISV